MSVVTIDHQSDAVALVTLNRPDSLNAFNTESRAAFFDALAKLSADKNIRVIVITGAGRGFCAGADLKDVGGGRNVEDILNAEYGAFLSVIRTCEKPVIAAVNGPAAGIGMTLALTCDLRVMASEGYLMSAFANIGLVPDGGLSLLLTQQLGYARAYEYAIEAKKITAQECLDLGLVNRVTPAKDVVSNALDWAAALARRAPISNALAKRAFRAAAHQTLPIAISYEAQLQRIAIESEDCREGVAAVLGKRAPVFKNR